MTTADHNARPGFTPPSPADLLARYLHRQAEAHAAGLAAADLTGEVQPYEAGPVQPVDARPAWDEAVAAARLLNPAAERGLKAPPGWAPLVAGHEPAFDLALALGNFPQLVRNLQPLLRTTDLAGLRGTKTARAVELPALTGWAEQAAAEQAFPQAVLAVGALRLARQYDRADRVVGRCDGAVPADWRASWENEKAALAWHRGQAEEARRSWLAQPESAPVLFNRGMAALFLGHNAEAREPLARAAALLPERGAWHHLARLYLTLAQR